MAIITNTLPQNIKEIKTTKLKDLIHVLPEKIAYNFNVWIDGKMAKFGITTDNLIFLIQYDSDSEPSSDIKLYFNGLVSQLNIEATVSTNWKNNIITALRLYNNGNLIIDKDTLKYKEFPEDTIDIPIIRYTDVISRLPDTINWKCTIWLTGGIVKNGWSANDIDLIIFEPQDGQIYSEIKSFFSNLFGYKVDVGTKIMKEREPVYLYKLYSNGELCQY